jgi:four helix bundle protein
MKFDLEDRLIKFGVLVLDFAEQMPEAKASSHLSGQLIRSGTAPALIYGEANAAEYAADFIHKMGMALKELHETKNCLRMIQLKKFFVDIKLMDQLLDENVQLIKIFGASINTAKHKLQPKP